MPDFETETQDDNNFDELTQVIEQARAAKAEQLEAPIEEETITDVIETQQQEQQEAPAAAPAPAEADKPTDTVDYTKYFDTLSEGFVKDDEGFKTVVTKAKGYDELENKLKDIEASIPQFKNDESRAFYEALANGDTDAIAGYIAEKNKDYKTMADIDIVRETLSKKNPGWNSAEVELELRYQYGENLEKINLDNIEKEDEDGKITYEYQEAVKHNKEVDNNLMKLQRDARDGRPVLLEHQSKIEIPTIKKTEAPAPTGPTDAEIAERTEKWIKDVKDQMPNFKAIKLNIDDKEVEYVLSDDDQKEAATKMENFNIPDFIKENGWFKEDGTPNILKIAEDRQWLKDKGKIAKSLATQVKTDTTKSVIAKIKNVDGTITVPQDPQAFDTLEEAVASAKKAKGWSKA